jgi:hypothetical protein
MVAGEPGRSFLLLRLSEDDGVRMPRNLRTDPAFLVSGLAGDRELTASLVRVWWSCTSAMDSSRDTALSSRDTALDSVLDSSDVLPGGGDVSWT